MRLVADSGLPPLPWTIETAGAVQFGTDWYSGQFFHYLGGLATGFMKVALADLYYLLIFHLDGTRRKEDR